MESKYKNRKIKFGLNAFLLHSCDAGLGSRPAWPPDRTFGSPVHQDLVQQPEADLALTSFNVQRSFIRTAGEVNAPEHRVAWGAPLLHIQCFLTFTFLHESSSLHAPSDLSFCRRSRFSFKLKESEIRDGKLKIWRPCRPTVCYFGSELSGSSRGTQRVRGQLSDWTTPDPPDICSM